MNFATTSTNSTPNSVTREGSPLSRFYPGHSDRALLVGQTGSGKTTLARYLLLSRRFRVVADYKGRINWPEYEVCKTLKKLCASSNPALLYRPDYAESRNEEKQNEFWQWIYERGNTTAYIDELTTIAQGDVYPWYYGACLVRGRELGVEVWSATQRPKNIPQVTLSEAEHTYSFRLQLPQDRERVEQFTGIPRTTIERLQKREFVYKRQDDSPVGPLSLSL